mmetsp:Transcript_24788/g.81078  ORF Transcript_24788/g.81078 Transcript_24788/m.81078 type:complete len:320 (+) Transcript_24788:2947-3906(+)
MNGAFGWATQPNMRSILLSAIMKGVLRRRSRSRLSSVCCSSPCMMSTTKMARSHRLDPRLRRLVKLSCPGVSMTSKPGTLSSKPSLSRSSVRCSIAESGMKVAPICCVMPPASPSCTLVRRMLSKIFVLPVSTWPRMQITGDRRRFSSLFFCASAKRARRASRALEMRSRSARSFSSSSESLSLSLSESLSLSLSESLPEPLSEPEDDPDPDPESDPDSSSSSASSSASSSSPVFSSTLTAAAIFSSSAVFFTLLASTSTSCASQSSSPSSSAAAFSAASLAARCAASSSALRLSSASSSGVFGFCRCAGSFFFLEPTE